MKTRKILLIKSSCRNRRLYQPAIDGQLFYHPLPDQMCMPSPPKKQLIDPTSVLGMREIPFQDRRESGYPQLLRLCADFDFRVLQLQRKLFSHLSRKMVPGPLEFILALRDEHTGLWCSVSPVKESLLALDSYCKAHEIDLLHLQLFGDEDTELLPQAALY